MAFLVHSQQSTVHSNVKIFEICGLGSAGCGQLCYFCARIKDLNTQLIRNTWLLTELLQCLSLMPLAQEIQEQLQK
jgi:hypothetical protein